MLTNHGDYFSPHYLSSILPGDLKSTLDAWKNHATEHPDSETHAHPADRLRRLAPTFFRSFSTLQKTRNPAERLAVQRDFTLPLLQLLGYDIVPSIQQTGPDPSDPKTLLPIPILAAVPLTGAPLLWILATAPQDPTDSPCSQNSTSPSLKNPTLSPPPKTPSITFSPPLP